MKKLIALTLSVLFVLMSFTSCGNKDAASSDNASSTPTNTPSANTPSVTLAACDIEFSDYEQGTLDYTSVSEFTVKSDAAYQSMTKEYIFLPIGTVISCDKEFMLYTYSGEFILNTGVMQSFGFSVSNYDPAPKTGKITLTEDCYVRLSVKGALTDVKIEVPEERKLEVMCSTENILKFQKDIQLANNFYSANANNVNYIFLTDIHHGSEVLNNRNEEGDGYESVEAVNAKRDKYIKNYLEKVVAVANTSPYVDFVVIGGDIINGYETPDSFSYKENKKSNPNLTIGQHLVLQHQEILAPFKNCTKPVFITPGNHDDNNGHSIYYVDKKSEWLLSDLDWDRGVFKEFITADVVRDPDYSYKGKSISKYYYYDLEKNGKTTRIICLDYNDDRFTFDSTGKVTAQPNWGEYHEGQLKWLAGTALQGDFDECIVFSHATYVTSRGDALDRILEAYQTKDRVKMPSLSVDFANRTSGNILTYHHGHEHDHERTFDYKKRLWRIETPMTVSAIDLVSVGSEKTFVRTLDETKPLIYELLINGTQNEKV